MSGAVFLEQLRRTWRGSLLWSLVVAGMGLYIVLLIPDSKLLKQYGDLLSSMPPFIINLAGGSGADAAFIATPQGFLAFGFFGSIMLVLSLYAVLAGLNITANDEERGIMDVVLSLPLPRWRVVLEKFLAYSVSLIFILGISFVAIWLGIRSVSIFQISTVRLLEASVNIIPSTLLVMAFTAFVGSMVRRKNTAAAIAATFVAGSYFIDVIGLTAQVADPLRALSYFNYYDATGVMRAGLVPANVFGLLTVAVLMVAGAIWAFQYRDIGV
jgi:ABC-2 type transport system permease protein